MGVLGLVKVFRESCPAVGLFTRCEKGEKRKFPFTKKKKSMKTKWVRNLLTHYQSHCGINHPSSFPRGQKELVCCNIFGVFGIPRNKISWKTQTLTGKVWKWFLTGTKTGFYEQLWNYSCVLSVKLVFKNIFTVHLWGSIGFAQKQQEVHLHWILLTSPIQSYTDLPLFPKICLKKRKNQ